MIWWLKLLQLISQIYCLNAQWLAHLHFLLKNIALLIFAVELYFSLTSCIQPTKRFWNTLYLRMSLKFPELLYEGMDKSSLPNILFWLSIALSYPKKIKAAYLSWSVHPYIPNLLRCFQCHHYGHSKTSCHGSLTGARCSEVGHEKTNCDKSECCVNCKGDHPAFSRLCPKWIFEKEIQVVKTTKKKFPT